MLTINLLPPEEKSHVRLDMIRRIIVFFGVLASAVFFAGTALLIPSYLFSHVRARALAYDLNVEEEAADRRRLSGTASALRKSAVQAALVREFAAAEGKSGDTLEIFLRRVPGVNIDALTITKTGAVAMSGIAATRADLLLFESAVRNSNALENMSIPLSSIIRESNIRFSVRGTLKADVRP